MEFKIIGEYKYFTKCRFCDSKNIVPVINLGLMPLAGGFIKNAKNMGLEKLYPLELNFCKNCYLLQVNSSINPDTLFKDYFYFSSSMTTLTEHFKKVAEDSKSYLGNPRGKFVVEIGSNDGGFIKEMTKLGFNALGVDPASNVVTPIIKKGVPIINDYFTERLAQKIIKKSGQADAIYSFHTMAHIEDMKDVFAGIKKLLKKNGYLAMEVHYLSDLIKDIQYDMIYHEHQFYYTILSLKNFLKQYNLEIFEVKKSNVRAGSITYFIKHQNGKWKKSAEVDKLLKLEKANRLDKAQTYITFAKKIELSKKQLITLLEKLKRQKKKIVGYGASGRGTIIANYTELTPYLNYIVDDAKAKHGSLLPGTHHRIFPSEKMLKDKVDYALLFAWPFFEEVKKRNPNFKGKFIVPLPKVKII